MNKLTTNHFLKVSSAEKFVVHVDNKGYVLNSIGIYTKLIKSARIYDNKEVANNVAKSLQGTVLRKFYY